VQELELVLALVQEEWELVAADSQLLVAGAVK